VELLKFVQVPIPWIQRLIGTKGSTHDLALELLAESWLTGKNTVVVSNILAERVSLSRDAKWRALQQLEERGLIRLERETKKAGRATLLLSEKSDNLSEN
jgi:predicted ArsR family transcriptional regulator